MSDKKAFVFDTNFIIRFKHLDEVINNVKDDFSVYVSQVSIDERIAQVCRDLKKKYDDAEARVKELSPYASLKINLDYDKACAGIKISMLDNYSKAFGDKIIPFSADQKTFSEVIKRANKKDPPFLSSKDASDKGFKDCLLWLSLVSYFKNDGESEVIFSTDDKGFVDNASFLTNEFLKETGKKIIFVKNDFYFDRIKPKQNESEDDLENRIRQRETLRLQFNETLKDFCGQKYVNEYGEEYRGQSFITFKKLDRDYIENIYNNLEYVISNNFFRDIVSASAVFNNDPEIVDGNNLILMTNLERLNKLYINIKNNFPELLTQFLDSSVEIINSNYKYKPSEKTPSTDSIYGEPPF